MTITAGTSIYMYNLVAGVAHLVSNGLQVILASVVRI